MVYSGSQNPWFSGCHVFSILVQFGIFCYLLFFSLAPCSLKSFGYVPIGKTREKLLAQYTYWWLNKCFTD